MQAIIFSTLALAIALFGISYTLMHRDQSVFQPLIGVLLCLGVLSTGPLIFQLSPGLIQWYVAGLPVVFFALLPGLWFYHQALVSQTPWRWGPGAGKHLRSLPFAAALALAVLILPDQEFDGMFFSDAAVESVLGQVVAFGFFIAILAWCLMSLVYARAIFRTTVSYHQSLRQTFADDQGKRIGWVEAISVLLLLTWVYSLFVLIAEDSLRAWGISEDGVFILLLIVTWILCLFGLRQQPGFTEVYEREEAVTDEAPRAKYERSALESSDFERIAGKLTQAVVDESLYRDSDLNLYKLADHTGVTKQYISQTLSQHLDTTFFDFVNQARINAAKPLLLGSDQTVLDIALDVGFNARSSFYKAFRKLTGMTPSEFRKTAH